MLNVRLFGKLSLQRGDAELDSLRFGKLAELFCYLLVHRDRPHSREVLSTVLWGDSTTAQSRKYLRQALWQLQRILRDASEAPVLLADRSAVQMQLTGDVWVDVSAFEAVCVPLQQVAAGRLTAQQAASLTEALDLYRGDLLEGWYQDWCLFDRERLENLYLLSLEKLMSYSEEQKQYAAGLEMGERILRLDRAHERTYQTMIRMQAAAGDRAAAIRLYQRCEAALREELGVGPAGTTVELIDRIRGEHALPCPVRPPKPESLTTAEGPSAVTLRALVLQFRRLVALLGETQIRIEKQVDAMDKIEAQPHLKPVPRRVSEP